MDYYMQYYIGSELDDEHVIEEEPPERWKWEYEEEDGWEEIF